MKKILSVLLAMGLIFCWADSLTEDTVIEPVRDEAHKCFRAGLVSEGFTWIIVAGEEAGDPWEDGQWYIIDVYGRRLTDDSVEVWPRYFKEGLVSVGKGGKAGCIDTAGNVVIPFDYNYIDKFHHGVAIAKKDGKYGLISCDNQIVLPFEWDKIDEADLPDNAEVSLYLVERDGKYGIVDMNGREKIPCIMDYIDYPFFEPSWPLLVSNGQSFGYVDQTGTMTIPCQWPNAQCFQNGVAKVYTGEAFAFIEVSGEILFTVPEDWRVIGNFSEGLALTLDNESRFGWIDTTGTLAIPFKDWENAKDFCEGRAVVTRNGKIGFIDNTGNEVIPCEWDDAKPFYQGYAPVCKNGEWYVIDLEGRVMARFGNTVIYNRTGHDSLYTIKDETGKCGLIRPDGVTVTPCQWDFVLEMGDGVIKVTDPNRKYGFINTNGETIVPCVYDEGYYGDGYFTLIRDGYLTVMDIEGNIVF